VKLGWTPVRADLSLPGCLTVDCQSLAQQELKQWIHSHHILDEYQETQEGHSHQPMGFEQPSRLESDVEIASTGYKQLCHKI
jgi:hypothetical protein